MAPKNKNKSNNNNNGNYQQQQMQSSTIPETTTTSTTSNSTSEKDLKFMEQENYYARKLIPAEFYMIASASDNQNAQEAYNMQYSNEMLLPNAAGSVGGACTSALLTALHRKNRGGGSGSIKEDKEKITWVQMLQKMRKTMNKMNHFHQTPQLSSSRMIDVNKPMQIVPSNFTIYNEKRALLIGINYVNAPSDKRLRACHNDVYNMKRYLNEKEGFKDRDMLLLLDDEDHGLPTKTNILNGFKMLVEQSQPGDVVFVQFSGHGGQVLDVDGDEDDGYDETIYPCDYDRAGCILDDDIYRKLVKPMSNGVHCTVLMDCCHSGSVLDLPYECNATHLKMKIQKDFDSNLYFKDITDRINRNDRTLTELILDPGNKPLDADSDSDATSTDGDDSTVTSSDNDDEKRLQKKKPSTSNNEFPLSTDEKGFLKLNKAIRQNYRIEKVIIRNHFFDSYTKKQQTKLLKSVGCLDFCEIVEIYDCNKLKFDQVKFMALETKSIRQIRIGNIAFDNTGSELKEFIEFLRVDTTILKYNFDDCRFVSTKEKRPDELPKFRKPRSTYEDSEEDRTEGSYYDNISGETADRSDMLSKSSRPISTRFLNSKKIKNKNIRYNDSSNSNNNDAMMSSYSERPQMRRSSSSSSSSGRIFDSNDETIDNNNSNKSGSGNSREKKSSLKKLFQRSNSVFNLSSKKERSSILSRLKRNKKQQQDDSTNSDVVDCSESSWLENSKNTNNNNSSKNIKSKNKSNNDKRGRSAKAVDNYNSETQESSNSGSISSSENPLSSSSLTERNTKKDSKQRELLSVQSERTSSSSSRYSKNNKLRKSSSSSSKNKDTNSIRSVSERPTLRKSKLKSSMSQRF